jgi:hypothetical protein
MTDLARDQFARYFTEKLWDWIPAMYRDADGQDTPNKHVLRGLVQAIAEHAAISRRSIDRLWENQSIEMCDDWAVALIGELVGTRMVPALNRRGRRVDVARTIHYRRRSGTLHVLNQLILDIAGWDGKVVESFRTLGRTHHALDPLPLVLGRYTHTPAAGIADIRRTRGTELVDGPWDELAHTADLRPNRGRDGLHSIRGLNFHLHRQRAYRVTDPTPVRFTAKRWTFDPSGRDIQLFMPSFRPEKACSARHEWDVAGPIRCRLLGHAEYVITEAALVNEELGQIPGFAIGELRTLMGLRFRDEFRLRATLAATTNSASLDTDAVLYALLASGLTDDSAKAVLVRDGRAFRIEPSMHAAPIPAERIFSGNLSSWTLPVPTGKILAVDPVRGRMWFPDDAAADLVIRHYYYGFTGDLGAGTYDRSRHVLPATTFYFGGTFANPAGNAVGTFTDSKTYIVSDVTFATSLVLQASSLERPYLRRNAEEHHDWIFTPSGEDAELTLEGLWYGGGRIILHGDFKKFTIRHCTLDPGGERADGAGLDPAEIVVEAGTIEQMVIESSIFAGISYDPETAGILALEIRDSIAHAVDPDLAIAVPGAELTIERSTLAMPVTGLRINATDILAQQPITVVDRQNGCVRFSILAPLSETPPIYRGEVLRVENCWFTSRRFGDPGYFALSECAPEKVTRGAENGSELGAFSSLINPLKHDSLRTKVHEFMPLGRLPAFVRET